MDANPIIDVTLVRTDACHLCDDAARALDACAAEHALRVTALDLRSAEGAAIMRAHRAPMAPIVLVEGELLGWGRLSRHKLRRRIEQLERGAHA